MSSGTFQGEYQEIPVLYCGIQRRVTTHGLSLRSQITRYYAVCSHRFGSVVITPGSANVRPGLMI